MIKPKHYKHKSLHRALSSSGKQRKKRRNTDQARPHKIKPRENQGDWRDLTERHFHEKTFVWACYPVVLDIFYIYISLKKKNFIAYVCHTQFCNIECTEEHIMELSIMLNLMIIPNPQFFRSHYFVSNPPIELHHL